MKIVIVTGMSGAEQGRRPRRNWLEGSGVLLHRQYLPKLVIDFVELSMTNGMDELRSLPIVALVTCSDLVEGCRSTEEQRADRERGILRGCVNANAGQEIQQKDEASPAREQTGKVTQAVIEGGASKA